MASKEVLWRLMSSRLSADVVKRCITFMQNGSQDLAALSLPSKVRDRAKLTMPQMAASQLEASETEPGQLSPGIGLGRGSAVAPQRGGRRWR